MYALAATAAGVGTLAFAQLAEARIVYTPAHVVLTGYPHTSFNLDLNHDGINDFRLVGSSQAGQSSSDAFIECFSSVTVNEIRGRGNFASALPAGLKVGPRGPFSHYNHSMGLVGYSQGYPPSFRGPWVNHGKGVKNRYLGFKFAIKGKVHYGWARLSVTVQTVGGVNLTATLTGYAYETIPKKPIITGKTAVADDSVEPPATLGRLAVGRK